MEVYGLNLNTIGWEIEGQQMTIDKLFDLEEVLHGADEYCNCCAAYLPIAMYALSTLQASKDVPKS